MSDACSVHNVTLVNATVLIAYGFVLPRAGFAAASVNFPNWKQRPLGGCCVGDDKPVSARVRYCPACEAARMAWESAERARTRPARRGSGS